MDPDPLGVFLTALLYDSIKTIFFIVYLENMVNTLDIIGYVHLNLISWSVLMHLYSNTNEEEFFNHGMLFGITYIFL
jgi:hypothetical protein